MARKRIDTLSPETRRLIGEAQRRNSDARLQAHLLDCTRYQERAALCAAQAAAKVQSGHLTDAKIKQMLAADFAAKAMALLNR